MIDQNYNRNLQESKYVTVTCTFEVLETQLSRLQDLYEGVSLSFTPFEMPNATWQVNDTPQAGASDGHAAPPEPCS